MHRVLQALAVIVLLAVTAAQAEPPAKEPDIDAKAEAAVTLMCDFLKKQPVMAFRAEVSQEEVYPSGQTIQVNREVEVVLKRPDKLYVRITGDDRDRVFCYDGKVAVRADLDKKVYAVVEAPPTVDAMLAMFEEKYGINAPLSDLIMSDPCAGMLDNVLVGDYLGLHLAAGKTCRHLAFTQRNVDWQLWIEEGAWPLPRKVVITDKGKAGWPQYSATLKDFSFHPRIAKGLFTFRPAKGDQQIDFLARTGSPVEKK